MRQREWPDWWDWELDTTSPHLAKRMRDRGFNEVDLRAMLASTVDLLPNHEPGRWVAQTSWCSRPWEVILEPLHEERVVLVITAYRID